MAVIIPFSGNRYPGLAGKGGSKGAEKHAPASIVTTDTKKVNKGDAAK
jgi:hypothetical protein